MNVHTYGMGDIGGSCTKEKVTKLETDGEREEEKYIYRERENPSPHAHTHSKY